MKTYGFWLAGLLSATAAGWPAHAAVVTRCGGSAGVAYEFPGLSDRASGWQKDSIRKGGIQLIVSGTEADVVYTDGSGGTKSAKGDGFLVMPVPQPNSTRRLILGIHPDTGVVEHWLFDLDGSGNGTVVWGTIRGGTMFPKSSLMKADCFGP